jgi:hypothetical protein
MRQHLMILGLFALSLTRAPLAQAIDRSGNYTTADFFPTRDEYALSTWKVVANRLHCRQRPGITQPIVLTFSQHNHLRVKTAEGSHENVGYLQMDAQGQPWMRVYQIQHLYRADGTPAPSGICFVRAHRSYIAPL